MEVDKLHRQLVKGFFSLTFRKIALDTIRFITIFIILAKVLPIEVIGIYGIAQVILSFFTYFSDVGLGAALIQKKEITHDDLKTTFLIQEILILLIVVAVWFLAPLFAYWYKFDEPSMWLIRVLGIAFFLNSLKVIPSNLLERELKFEPIVFVEIVEAIIFNSLLIYLTFSGLGVTAFSFATLVSALAATILLNIIAPWKMSIGFSKASAKTLFNFGIPFQVNSALAMLKDRLTPLITATIVGNAGFGYLTWAQGIAFRPLEIMNVVIRITFPAFSRLQENHSELKRMVEKSLFLTVSMIYPFLFGMLAVLPIFISFMGKQKFTPALPLIYLFAFSTFWAVPSTTFTNVLNAIGRVGITLKLMVMWTILTWVLSPILAYFYGYFGVALASAIISFTSIVPIIIVSKLIKVDIVNNVWQPLVSSLVMGLIVYAVSLYLPVNLLSIVALVIIGILIYSGLIMLLAKEKLMISWRELRGKDV